MRPRRPADKAGHVEGQLAIARAAIDASEFARAREVLAPYVNDPTQRVALLMAELERTEHGDGGRARAWTLRAVRARHDPAWTADGYVSDRWRPVSPVTGRLDAFQWQTPVASLPSDKGATIESSAFEEAMLAAPPPKRVTAAPSEARRNRLWQHRIRCLPRRTIRPLEAQETKETEGDRPPRKSRRHARRAGQTGP